MGLGGYRKSSWDPVLFFTADIARRIVASQAELDHFHYLRRQTAARVLRSCSGEMEREVHSILGPLGVKEALSRLVAEDLRAVEEDVWGDRAGGEGTEGVVSATASSGKAGDVTAGRRGWGFWRTKDKTEEEDGGVKGNEDMGLTAFLLKFGEGLGQSCVSRCSF
jgi:hypothetical protein